MAVAHGIEKRRLLDHKAAIDGASEAKAGKTLVRGVSFPGPIGSMVLPRKR